MDQLIADAVADPEIAGAAEAVAGNNQQILQFCLFREGIGIAAGGFDEQVESAVGFAIS